MLQDNRDKTERFQSSGCGCRPAEALPIPALTKELGSLPTCRVRVTTQGENRMRENFTSGSVRGVRERSASLP